VAGPSGVVATVKAYMDRPSPAVPSTGTILVKTNDIDTPEESMSGEGGATASPEPIVGRECFTNYKAGQQ